MGRYAKFNSGFNLGPMVARPTTDMLLLSKAMTATQLSARQFAAFIVRDVRNVYRWVKGDTSLPQAVRDRCTQILAMDQKELREEVDAWIVKEFRRKHQARSG